MNLPKTIHPRSALLAASLVLFLGCDDAQQAVKRRAAEAAGNIAIDTVTNAGETGRAADLINIPVEVRQLHDIVYQARGVGNVQLVATSEGHVVFDTGLVLQAAKQRRLLVEAVPGAIRKVVLSHSHQDHIGGTSFWVDDETEIVAHREFPEEQRYQEELQPYLWHRNQTLFPFMPEEPPPFGFVSYTTPTVLVDNGEPQRFELGGVKFELIGAPGAEGADNLVLWLPDQKILLSGDFFGPLFPQFPNVFTMRGEKMRKPIEYVRSLERIIELEPAMIIPSHNDPIEGAEKIRADLERMRDAVQYVHDATVAGMNAGKTVHQLMEEIELPPELALSQIHGRVSWAVKSIWEYYATWFHFDSTVELYPVPASAVYAELRELAGLDALIESATRRLDAGQPVHALQLLEVALAEEADHAAALELRKRALQQLLDAATAGLNNSYEVDWLKYRLRDTDARLGVDPS